MSRNSGKIKMDRHRSILLEWYRNDSPVYWSLCTWWSRIVSISSGTRLFRMMRVEGQYLESFDMFGKIFKDNAMLCNSWIRGFHDLDSLFCIVLLGWQGYCECRYGWKIVSIDSRGSYFTLLNLFGEYPLIDTHSNWGRVVGSIVAIVAVVMFAIPTVSSVRVLRTCWVRDLRRRGRKNGKEDSSSTQNEYSNFLESKQIRWTRQLMRMIFVM